MKEKSTPKTSFNIPVTIKISLSTTDDIFNNFKKYCENQNKTQQEVWDSIINKKLKKSNIKSVKELARKSEAYKPFALSLKNKLCWILETTNISKYMFNEVNKIINEK